MSKEEACTRFVERREEISFASGEIVRRTRTQLADSFSSDGHRRKRRRSEGSLLRLEPGTTILKFMLHISKDEQKRRSKARIENPKKRWKFSTSDLKERPFWGHYQEAYEDAINCCATDYAPWYVVPANHKWARDLAIAEIVWRVLKKMKPRYPKIRFDPTMVTID